MKLLFLLISAIDIKDINSGIPSDNLSTSGDWSTFEDAFLLLIPRYIFPSMFLIITVYLLGIVLRSLMGITSSPTAPTEPSSPINKITSAVSVNSPFQTQIKQVDLKKQEINNLLFF